MGQEEKNGNTIPEVTFEEFAIPSYDEWKAEAEAALKGAPFEKKLFTKTYEGITLEPIYTPEHSAALQQAAGYPGLPEFLRNTDAAGDIVEPWTIAQGVSALDPSTANEILKDELSRGGQGVNLSLNEGVKKGGDSASVSAKGLLIATLADLEATLKDIDLSKHELHVNAGVSALPMLGFLAARDEKGISGYKGCVGADPVGVLAENGKLDCSLDSLYDEMAAASSWAVANASGLRTILIDGAPYHNGGASAVQEIGYCMSVAIDYIEAMLARGMKIDEIAQQIRFSFSIGANFFMEIAKLRAARLVWSQVIAAYGGNECSQKINVLARTSFFTKTVYDPFVNILRSTTQAFSAVVGGVDAMDVTPFDEAIGSPDELSRRIARNQQIMLQNEFNLTQPVDPAGGSWYVETLTAQVAQESWKVMQACEKAGGMVEALKAGSIQEEVGAMLQQRLKNVRTRADRAVGVNMYANMLEKPHETEKVNINAILSARQKEVQAFRAGKDQAVVDATAAVGKAQGAAKVDALKAAAAAGCTLSEMSSVLRQDRNAVSVQPIEAHRWTEEIEAMRQATADYVAKTGKNLQVFLANMGPIPQHKPRADFSTGFMEVAGFEVLKNNGFATVEEAAEAAAQSGAQAAVICSTDDTYPELVPPLAKLIKEKCPNMVVYLAGAPAAEYKDSYVEAGVDDFIHVKANCYDILRKLQQIGGIC